MILARTLLLLTILALPLAASAQHPLAGAWQETQIGFLVTFSQQPNGQLTGTLQGQEGPMPLNIVSDLRSAQGSFLLAGQTVGFSAQLQPDDSTLLIWLFEFDAGGQPLQDSYEQYQAYRGGSLPVPPAASQPGMPGAGGASAPPTAPGYPVTPGSGPSPQQGDITGNWRAEGQFDNGAPYTVELMFDASGAWRMDLVVEGQPFAYFGGPYTFSQDGVLRYQEAIRSPQVCYQGECQANPFPDSSGDDQVHFPDPNTMVTTDAQSGEQTVYRRSAVGAGLPQVPGFGVPPAPPPLTPPVAGGFPPTPPGGGFPAAPPFAGGFPPTPPAGGGFPAVPPASPPGPSGSTAPVSASSFIGMWESEQKLNDTLTVSLVSSFGADGSWRQDFSHQGIPAAFYEGSFTVSPQGVVQLQVNNRSAQLCLQGSCLPTSDKDIIRTFHVTFPVPDTLEMVGVDSKGAEVRLTYHRSSRNGM